MNEIKKLREALNLTQTAFAKKIGVNQHTVWRWEHYGIPRRGSVAFLLEQLWKEVSSPEIEDLPESCEDISSCKSSYPCDHL